MDINMPRDKETGKTKGFAFLMYEDQRSTVLAVDNLNGAKVIEKTLRVDHVRQYKQPKVKNEEGEWVDVEEQSLNARPEMIVDEGGDSDNSSSSEISIDPEDPMYEYLVAKRKEEKAVSNSKKSKKTKNKDKSKKRENETAEERRARKERKREKKAKKGVSDGVKGVQDLLQSLGGDGIGRNTSQHSSDDRSRRERTRSPGHDYEHDSRRRHSPDSNNHRRGRRED
jgi:RNA-binding motif X-linked protein 2